MSYNKETGMYEGFIYKIYNDVNDKIYIGQTILTVSLRWSSHKAQVKKHTSTDKLHNAMEKHGIDSFYIQEIGKYIAKTRESLIELLDEKEKYYIEQYDSYYNGYNATKGGRDGVDHQRRPVIRYSLIGEEIDRYESVEELKTEFDTVSTIYDCCANNCKYAYGSIWRYEDSQFDIPKLSDDEIREATIRYLALNPIDKYDYKGNKLKTYKNINDVLEHENVTRAKLIKVCTGRSVYVGTDIYRFSCDSFDTYRTYKEKPKLVEQYDLEGNFIRVFESARAASRSIGSNGTNVTEVCNGHQKTAGGYMWKYVEDNSPLPDLEHNAHCKEVYQYSKNGELIKIHSSIQDAAKETGLSVTTISKQALGQVQSICSDYVFGFCELSIDEVIQKTKNKNSKIVYQYNLNNEFIAKYESIKEAGKCFTSSNANISIGACCRKIKKTAYGYKWYFEDDPNRPENKIAS